MAPGKHFYWLDWLRFGAALAVVLCHARPNNWAVWADLDGHYKNWLTGAFFGLMRPGVEAVVVFFVLSGFLVGGKVLDRMMKGTFDIRAYAVDRVFPSLPASHSCDVTHGHCQPRMRGFGFHRAVHWESVESAGIVLYCPRRQRSAVVPGLRVLVLCAGRLCRPRLGSLGKDKDVGNLWHDARVRGLHSIGFISPVLLVSWGDQLPVALSTPRARFLYAGILLSIMGYGLSQALTLGRIGNLGAHQLFHPVRSRRNAVTQSWPGSGRAVSGPEGTPLALLALVRTSWHQACRIFLYPLSHTRSSVNALEPAFGRQV